MPSETAITAAPRLVRPDSSLQAALQEMVAYPPELARTGVGGTGYVEVRVDAKGRVSGPALRDEVAALCPALLDYDSFLLSRSIVPNAPPRDLCMNSSLCA